ncbi:MAG: AMP-binding protein [Actinomycetia bacterium]|nr:AMP-binding protein [Actinomycetes bacterium]MCP4957909.1 AMP-binding protein [Actinomycetes bacterium]
MKVPLTTMDFIHRAEQVYGDRIGLVDEPGMPGGGLGELTWKQIAELGRAQAAKLDELGIGFGDRVAMVSHNAGRLLTSFFGVTPYGRVFVPINFRLQRPEIEYIVEHCGARMLLVDPELEEMCKDLDVEHFVVMGTDSDPQMYLHGVDPQPWDNPDEDATAVINYTSGTTARPKGVQQTHRTEWLNATTFGWHTGVDDWDNYLHTLPLFHCNGWGMPFALAGMGCKNVIIREVRGAEILRRVQEHDVTLMCGAPAVVQAILDAAADWDGPIPGAGRTRMVVAGAPPPSQTIQRLEDELGWEFIQIYGLTETAPLITMNRNRREYEGLNPEEKAKALGRAGVPTVGIQVKIDGQGEILARGNHILEAYWEQPEATAEAIVDGWFHTGDGGEMSDDAYVTISDRKKDVIISGGENVSSIEVEDALFSHPEVAEVAVIGVPHEKWGETVKGLVVLTEGSTLTGAELIEYCRTRIAHYKCPTSIEMRDVLARTATGKLQKFKLRAPYWEDMERQVN